ncbi:MAG: HEPN domain-containing protein [Egibacteraceae bacterium]
MLSDEEDLPAWGTCFHAQQAAEKAIKALLVRADLDPPKTHNLVTLRGLLAEPSVLGLAQLMVDAVREKI